MFIGHIEASLPFADAAKLVIQQVKQQSATGVTSDLTLWELLVKPPGLGGRGLTARYESLVRTTPNLVLVDIGGRIVGRASPSRANDRLRTADALQMVTALGRGATAFVANDCRLRHANEVAVNPSAPGQATPDCR